MSPIRKKLLAGVAAFALLIGGSAFAHPQSKPEVSEKSSLTTSFNAAANATASETPRFITATHPATHDLELLGTPDEIARLNRILDLAADSDTAREIFDRNPMTGWTLFLDKMEPDENGFETAGYVIHQDKIMVLNQDCGDVCLTATVIHETGHIDQERLGIGPQLNNYTHAASIQSYKIMEASSAAIEPKSMREIDKKHPGTWEEFKQSDTWTAEYWEDAERSGLNPTMAVFSAFYEMPVSTYYEQCQAKKQQKQWRKLTALPNCRLETFCDTELPIAETVASMTLLGIPMYDAETASAIDLENIRFSGCNKDTVKLLRDAGITNLPKIRENAPSVLPKSVPMPP